MSGKGNKSVLMSELTANEKAQLQAEEAINNAKKKSEEAKAMKVSKAQIRIEDGKEINSGLLPKENERHLFHISMEKPAFDSKTGKKLSTEKIQKYTQVEFHLYKGQWKIQGWDVKVLWNPIEYK